MTSIRRTIFIWLCLLPACVLLSALFLYIASATAADDQEDALLGTLSERFESPGPGYISSGSGDYGGKSYGSYQFASDIGEKNENDEWGAPMEFANWCKKSKNTYYKEIGNRLSDAFHEGSSGYGPTFDETWKQLAKENRSGFHRAQRDYVRLSFYDPLVKSIESAVDGFSMDNYSIALRNVFWSRAVQHGAGGAKNVITRAFDALGGFCNQPERVLINAIYEESGAVGDPGTHTMSGESAEKYGISGRTLKYYGGNSSSVQVGVYLRLRINEPAIAQSMLVEYGYEDALISEGVYRIQPSDNSKLTAVAGSSSASLNTVSDSNKQRFRLTYYASGYYTIESVSSGKRLTANSDGTVSMAEPSVSNRQFWKLDRFNSGFSLLNRGTGQYLTAASYAAGGKLNTGETAAQWQLPMAGSGWSLDGASYPTYANSLTEGASSYPLRGMLRCSYPIQSVKVSILDAHGDDAITPATAKPNATSYDLSALDDYVAFSRLRAGSYKLVISATSSSPTDSSYTMDSPFYVEDRKYQLTFDACGGSCKESSRTVASGQMYGELPTPSRDGYEFLGWYTAPTGGNRVDDDTVATGGDVTVYAHYRRVYTYRFVNYDGKVITSGELAYGKTIPAPQKTPTKPSTSKYSYVFSSWEGYTKGMTMGKSDLTFTALFKAQKIEQTATLTSSSYTLTEKYLRAIPTGTSVETLQKDLTPKTGVTIRQGSAASDQLASTGMTVTYTVDGTEVQKVTVVVTGDVNGDGKCTVTDMVQLQSYLLNKVKFSAAAKQAADLSGDGNITITDMVQITSVLLGRTTIKPN